MFAKLLKHEFNANKGVFLILSLAALGVGFLGGWIMWFMMKNIESSASEMADAMRIAFGTFALMGVVLALCAYSIAVLIILLLRFYRHHFTHEGYLTFTLPATTHQILLASMTSIVIWLLISGIVLFLSIGMVVTPVFVTALKEIPFDLEEAFQAYRLVFDQLGISALLQIFSMISSFVYTLTLPLLCITIGSIVAKKHKLLASFGIYYGISFAISTLTGILNVVVTFAESIAEFRNAYTYSMVIPAILQLCIGIGSYFLMHYLVSKKLNLQ